MLQEKKQFGLVQGQEGTNEGPAVSPESWSHISWKEWGGRKALELKSETTDKKRPEGKKCGPLIYVKPEKES